MANRGPLGTDTNPGFIDDGTSALTHHRPPGPMCASQPTRTQLEHHLVQARHRLWTASTWIDTRSATGSLLGGGSFTAGVIAGMGKNLVTSVVEVVALFKTLALAEYYQARHAPGFWERLGHAAAFALMDAPSLAMGAGRHFQVDDHEARQAFEDREILFKTVTHAFEHPGDVLHEITAQQLAKYEEFKGCMARHTLAGDFNAGMLFGELLLDVLLIIDGATAVARIATKVPGLLRLSSKLEKLAPALRGALKGSGAAAGDAGKAVERVTPSQLRGAAREADPSFQSRTTSHDNITESRAGSTTPRTMVRNGYKYEFDDKNRVIRINGDLVGNSVQGRSKISQLRAGGVDRLGTDEGGHFVGRRFDGPLDDFNHFAQDRNFNRGAYKTLENSWQRALDNGSSVYVDIKPNYLGDSLRPQSLRIDYTIDEVPYYKLLMNRLGGQ